MKGEIKLMFISDSIKYVGVDDKDIDLFESQYVVPDGVSYNSYIIFDDKITIMDTVDARATEEWVKNVEEALDGKKPEYLVISHLEPDHAANIKLIADKYPDMKLIGNAKTFQMLPQFFDEDFSDRQVVVKEGDEISLGKHRWFTGRKLWLHTKRQRKYFSRQTDLESLVRLTLRTKKDGLVKQEDTILI